MFYLFLEIRITYISLTFCYVSFLVFFLFLLLFLLFLLSLYVCVFGFFCFISFILLSCHTRGSAVRVLNYCLCFFCSVKIVKKMATVQSIFGERTSCRFSFSLFFWLLFCRARLPFWWKCFCVHFLRICIVI